MNESTKQIVIAVVASAAAGGTAALVSYLLNRPKLTTMAGNPSNPNPVPVGNPLPPTPNPSPPPVPFNLLNIADQLAQGTSVTPLCPPRYHWGGYDADNLNLPKCIPDCPPGSHWGGYDADNLNLPLCVPDS